MYPSTSPRILLVDDHALFRTGLGMILREAFPGAALLEAPTLADALALPPGPPPDLIVLDVNLPDANGLASIEAVGAHFHGARVLIVSGSVEPAQVALARERGAVGYLSKSATGPQIIKTLQDCLGGGTAFPGLAYALPISAGMAARERPARPTSRQLDILRRVGEGAPNKVIARELGLSENDVRAEVSWLTEMLDATSRQQAYEVAVGRGWLNR